MEIKRTERGWPAHFCLVDRCLFRRNTLLERGDVRVVVSTVGGMASRRNPGEMEEIGLDRHYETMAFYAEQNSECGCWEANVDMDHEIYVTNWALSDPDAFHSDADKMHEEAIEEIIRTVFDD